MPADYQPVVFHLRGTDDGLFRFLAFLQSIRVRAAFFGSWNCSYLI